MKIKKILSTAMALTMVMPYMSTNLRTSDIPSAFAESETEAPTSGTCGAQGDNLTWTLDSEGTLTISGKVEMLSWEGSYDTPWYSYNEKIVNVIIEDGVTTIGDYAFNSLYNLTSVTIPDSVTSFGVVVFENSLWFENKIIENPLLIINGILIDGSRCEGDVIIPDNVTAIVDEAFAFNEILYSITMPDSVVSIGDRAFANCKSLSSTTIPDSVISIGDEAFWGCDRLSSITIPDSVTTIGDGAFMSCGELSSVTISKNITSISRRLFENCKSLTSITFSEIIPDFGKDVFEGTPWLEAKRTENPFVIVNGMLIDGKNNEGDIIIPDSVTDIGGGAFYDCRGLTSVTIPDSVTTIGKAAFYDCRGLTSVTIPDSVTTIGEEAFLFCKFTSITIPDSVTSIGEGAFRASELTTVTIPDSVTSIGIYTFAACDSLTSINVDPENKYYASEDGLLCNKDKTLLIQFPIGKNKEEYTIPDCITTIEDYAFQGCDLTTVIIPDSVTSIGEYAFKYCSQLTKVKIPESVTTIESHAFYSCNNLTTITIPYSVTDLGQGAFFECTKLTSITIENPECKIHGWDSTIYKKATIYGYEGSTAQAYAEEYHMKFVALDATTTAGDANNDGTVLLNDAVLILQHLGNPDAYPLSDQAKANADVSNPGDGITNKDALAIQRYILKVISNLPDYS